MFIYYEGNSWIHRRYLPGRYRNYDLYGGYKVGMRDYRGKGNNSKKGDRGHGNEKDNRR